MQFRAIATVKTFCKAFDESFKIKLPVKHDSVLHEKNSDKKKQMEALVINNIAIRYITMALLGDEEMYMVKEDKS